MEIKVGEYVRTDKGDIEKIKTVVCNDYPITALRGAIIIDDENSSIIELGEILKHSKNIINLIEVGDYVNGELVREPIYNGNTAYGVDEGYEMFKKAFGDIKSILTKEQMELAKIIGLLHDIGRFEQFKKFGSFSDKNVDHADESCNYLFKDGHIRDFIEDDRYDSIIEKAIRYHNKFRVPKLSDEELLFTKMIRDMDKVDIYKQQYSSLVNKKNRNETVDSIYCKFM